MKSRYDENLVVDRRSIDSIPASALGDNYTSLQVYIRFKYKDERYIINRPLLKARMRNVKKVVFPKYNFENYNSFIVTVFMRQGHDIDNVFARSEFAIFSELGLML